MKVKLTIYNGEKEYFSRAISTPCVIGRGKQSDVAILHPLISRRHCEIYAEDGRAFVRDLGSLNGTFYKDARIGRGVPIPFGASFMIGKLSFKVEEFADSSDDERVLDDAPTNAKEARAELRRRALKTLEDIERLAPNELGLTPESEQSVESEELELTPTNEASVRSEQNYAQEINDNNNNDNAEKAREENASVDAPINAPINDDVIDLEKFLRGEL